MIAMLAAVVSEWPRYRSLTTQSDVWTFRIPVWEIVPRISDGEEKSYYDDDVSSSGSGGGGR